MLCCLICLNFPLVFLILLVADPVGSGFVTGGGGGSCGHELLLIWFIDLQRKRERKIKEKEPQLNSHDRAAAADQVTASRPGTYRRTHWQTNNKSANKAEKNRTKPNRADKSSLSSQRSIYHPQVWCCCCCRRCCSPSKWILFFLQYTNFFSLTHLFFHLFSQLNSCYLLLSTCLPAFLPTYFFWWINKFRSFSLAKRSLTLLSSSFFLSFQQMAQCILFCTFLLLHSRRAASHLVNWVGSR